MKQVNFLKVAVLAVLAIIGIKGTSASAATTEVSKSLLPQEKCQKSALEFLKEKGITIAEGDHGSVCG